MQCSDQISRIGVALNIFAAVSEFVEALVGFFSLHSGFIEVCGLVRFGHRSVFASIFAKLRIPLARRRSALVCFRLVSLLTRLLAPRGP